MPTMETHKGRPRRVLVIEDNADSAEGMRELLVLHGHQVEVARNGPEGIEEARRFNPEVVLCDIALSGPMDGCDVARVLRQDPQLTTAFLIACTGGEDEPRLSDAGFDVHLLKPLELAALLRVVSSAGSHLQV